MGVNGQPQNCIDDIRCPAIKGLPRETIVMLHKSLVSIAHMRLSIESVNFQVYRSSSAVHESKELLRRLRREGF